MHRRLARAFATAVLVLGIATPAPSHTVHVTYPASAATVTGWTSTWDAALGDAPAVGGWNNQTLRQVIRTSLGGDQLRLHLSNRFASAPAVIGHVTIGTQMNGGSTQESTPINVTFGGSATLTLAPGASAVSDPIPLAAASATRLLVSIYVPAGANMVTSRHDVAEETNFNSNGGDASSTQYYPTSNTFGFYALLDGLDVPAAAPSTVVAIGDSITDGLHTDSDTDTRWPDYLAARAAAAGLAVTDQGISGSAVTLDQSFALSEVNRWTVDVLNQPGVRTVIDAGGINDVRAGVSAATLIAAKQQLIATTHAAGLRYLLTTLTAMTGSTGDSPAEETQLAAYNSWVRSATTGADGYFDFDAAIDAGGSVKPVYDSGDHLHPNSAGATALGNVIDVSKL
jgi:lysophospholipase L1-like esterase